MQNITTISFRRFEYGPLGFFTVERPVEAASLHLALDLT